MAQCKINPQGNYISWNEGWDLYNATSSDVHISHFCQSDNGIVYFLFPNIPYKTSYYICEALGTHLPLPKTMEELRYFWKVAADSFPNDTRCKNELMLPINDMNNEGVWTRHYDGEIVNTKDVAWNDGEPNGIHYENCAQMEETKVADIDCATRMQCALCEFKGRLVYSLLGTCEIELRNINFRAYQHEMGEVLFRGYGEYHIKMIDGVWQWINVLTNERIATMVAHKINYPMGRRLWNLTKPVCAEDVKQKILLLTPCKSNQYSCSDATCIPLEHRCDLKYDCVDHSDEANCDLVNIPEDYRSDLPPRKVSNDDDTVLPITFIVDIESVSADTTRMTVHLSYKIRMLWYDSRLNYVNIKINDSLNKLQYRTMQMIWSPKVGFVNTEGNHHTEVDIEASMHVNRLQDPSYRDDSVAGEGIILYNRIKLS